MSDTTTDELVEVDLDLDQLRARRLETAPARRIRFGGKVWELHPEVPFEVAEAWRTGKRRRCFELLLADPKKIDEFMALRPGSEDFFAVLARYDVSPGESQAS